MPFMSLLRPPLGVNNGRFEAAAVYIENDLKEMGADYTSYMGMID